MADLTCPCEDGLPDPCTLCGEPADGVCKIDLVNSDAYLLGWQAARMRYDRNAVRTPIYDMEAAVRAALAKSAIERKAGLRRIVSPPQEEGV